jgi:hypothetical protein
LDPDKTLPVLHCGAHLGEERLLYFEFQMLPVTWIESAPHLIITLTHNVMQLPCQNVIEATLWSTSNVKMKLNAFKILITLIMNANAKIMDIMERIAKTVCIYKTNDRLNQIISF